MGGTKKETITFCFMLFSMFPRAATRSVESNSTFLSFKMFILCTFNFVVPNLRRIQDSYQYTMLSKVKIHRILQLFFFFFSLHPYIISCDYSSWLQRKSPSPEVCPALEQAALEESPPLGGFLKPCTGGIQVPGGLGSAEGAGFVLPNLMDSVIPCFLHLMTHQCYHANTAALFIDTFGYV